MPNLSFFVARRYLVSKKSYNAINLISYISVLGVSIGTMALIVVMSVYNGFDEFIRSMYNAFDPDFKISLHQGKVFSLQSDSLQRALQHPDVAFYTGVLEESALIEYADRQTLARIKGVGPHYAQIAHIDSAVSSGVYRPWYQHRPYACLGSGVAYRISLDLDFAQAIKVWMPKRGTQVSLNPAAAFTTLPIVPSGVFSVEPEFDSQYVVVPIEFAQQLLDYDSTTVSHIELRARPGSHTERLHRALEQAAGSRFVVHNKYQQRELLYKIMQTERWAIFLILLFILLVASFNILASITMLIIDKEDDIQTLRSLGADQRTIRRIFVWEGWMITAIGGLSGLVLGYVLVGLQARFGFIGFPGDNLLLPAYPVKILLADFVLVLGTVAGVGFAITYLPARVITARLFRAE